MPPKQIVILVITFLLLIILFQNLDSIPLQLLVWQPDISVALILLVPFLLGIVAGWLFKSILVKRKAARKKAKAEKAAAEKNTVEKE